MLEIGQFLPFLSLLHQSIGFVAIGIRPICGQRETILNARRGKLGCYGKAFRQARSLAVAAELASASGIHSLSERNLVSDPNRIGARHDPYSAGTGSGVDCTVGIGVDMGVGVTCGNCVGAGIGVTTGVGDTVGVGVVVGKGVGLAMAVGVTIGVVCSPALSLEVPFVTGKSTLVLPGLSVDGGGVGIGVAGVITGEAIGVAVIISGCAFVATFLMPVPFPTFATSGTLLEKRKYQ